jgi:hypothetical protein
MLLAVQKEKDAGKRDNREIDKWAVSTTEISDKEVASFVKLCGGEKVFRD